MQARKQDEVRAAAAPPTAFPERGFGETLTQVDEAAILRAARQSPACFAPIYDRYFMRIYAYCAHRTDSACEAEDLTSQIFISALNNLDSYRGGLAAAWLFRIARSAVANYYRGQRDPLAFDDMAETLQTDDLPLLESVLKAERARSVRARIAALPADDRELIALRVDGGLASEEIGKILGMRAGAVRMKLHRVFKRLQTQLAEDLS